MKMTPGNKNTMLQTISTLLDTEEDVRVGIFRPLIMGEPVDGRVTATPGPHTYVFITRGPVSQLEEDVTGALERGKADL